MCVLTCAGKLYVKVKRNMLLMEFVRLTVFAMGICYANGVGGVGLWGTLSSLRTHRNLDGLRLLVRPSATMSWLPIGG
jgi:hypothetical protein